MNALQQRMAIDGLIDRVKSPRFADDRYYAAINQAIQVILDGRTESIKKPKNYSFQSSQMLRNQLQTLIAPTITAVPTGSDFVPLPTDYYYLTLMQATVTNNFDASSGTNAVRPITYGEVGINPNNPFKRPQVDKIYFNEIVNGWKLSLPSNSTCNQYVLDYLKMPLQVSIGNAGNKITDGGTLVIGTTYYVYDQAVENGTTYYDGTTFVAATVTLTSGTVIPASVVVNCNMPVVLHDEINRLAAAIMENSLENYLKEQSLKVQNMES